MTDIPEIEKVKCHFDKMADIYDQGKNKNSYYYNTIKTYVQRNVRPGKKVIEIGCATGEILECTKPSIGVGIDISPQMVRVAREKYPQYTFVNSAIEDYQSGEKFDYVLLIDVIHHVYDVLAVFKKIHSLCHPQTKIIVTFINPWWGPLLSLASKLKLKLPDEPLNYLERGNVGKIVELAGFKINQMGCLLLMPVFVPLVSFLANSVGVRLWGVNKLSFVQHMVIQPLPQNQTDLGLGCSVIIPCFNEEDNIQEAVRRIPRMGAKTEIIVVNDGSRDQTALRVREMQKQYPNLVLLDYSPNRGKGYAVNQGFAAATQDVLMILDADMTVMPEELPLFFEPLNKGLCRLVNGTRFVYPQENQSMRFLNNLGNKIFGLLMSSIVNQPLTDTLCGTKAFYRSDLSTITMGKDKWGDFDILFGIAKAGDTIQEIPVHYKQRKFGKSKMRSFQHGIHLLQACYRGFKEMIFVPNVPRKKPSRLDHEIEHGKYLSELGTGKLWYWETPAGKERYQRRCAMLTRHLTSDMTVLEVGCGPGYFTRALAQTGAKIIAIDISPALLDHAKQILNSSNVELSVGNAYQLSFPDKTFDAVIGSSILHHLDLDAALKEFSRVLKPGGLLHFTEPNMLNPEVFLERKIPLLRKITHQSPDETAFVRWPLKQKIRSFGFDRIEIFPFDFLHPLIPVFLIPLIRRTGDALEKIPLIKEIGGSLNILAKKIS